MPKEPLFHQKSRTFKCACGDEFGSRRFSERPVFPGFTRVGVEGLTDVGANTVHVPTTPAPRVYVTAAPLAKSPKQNLKVSGPHAAGARKVGGARVVQVRRGVKVRGG